MRILVKVHRSLQHEETDVKLDCSLASPDEELGVSSGLSVDSLAYKYPALAVIQYIVLSYNTRLAVTDITCDTLT